MAETKEIMLKSWGIFKKMNEISKKHQKHVVEYKKKVARVSNIIHLCIDNLNNLFALETNTY
jgi:hypothetical protein